MFIVLLESVVFVSSDPLIYFLILLFFLMWLPRGIWVQKLRKRWFEWPPGGAKTLLRTASGIVRI